MIIFRPFFRHIDIHCFLSQFLLIRFLPVLILEFSSNVYEGNPPTPSLSPCLPAGRLGGEGKGEGN